VLKLKNLEEEKQQLKKEKECLIREVRKKFKPNVKRRNLFCKKGAPLGHTGKGRERPKHIDEYIEVCPTYCPRCGNEEIRVYSNIFDERVVEDIEVKVKTTCYRIHHGYCKKCKKSFYPKDLISSSRIGPLAQAISGYLHYQGIPYRKVVNIFNDIFGLRITHSTLIEVNNKFSEKGKLLYEKIKELIRHSSWASADETGCVI
jgi:transposase